MQAVGIIVCVCVCCRFYRRIIPSVQRTITNRRRSCILCSTRSWKTPSLRSWKKKSDLLNNANSFGLSMKPQTVTRRNISSSSFMSHPCLFFLKINVLPGQICCLAAVNVTLILMTKLAHAIAFNRINIRSPDALFYTPITLKPLRGD